VAGSLSEALDCLEKDHAFLLKGDVFTEDFIDMWISTKRKEHDAIRLRPHPYEFFMYYDVYTQRRRTGDSGAGQNPRRFCFPVHVLTPRQGGRCLVAPK